MAASAEEVRSSVRVYLYVFAALGVLTVLTVAVSWLHLPVAGAIAVALLIAATKGSLVASFFMHLLHERRALYWILILCAVFFVALLLLPAMQTQETAGLIDQVR